MPYDYKLINVEIDGKVAFVFADELSGAIQLQPGSTLDQVSG